MLKTQVYSSKCQNYTLEKIIEECAYQLLLILSINSLTKCSSGIIVGKVIIPGKLNIF